MTAEGVFEDIELAEDLQLLLKKNMDVSISDELLKQVKKFKGHELLAVKKKIASPIQILHVQEVNDKYVKDSFPSMNKS